MTELQQTGVYVIRHIASGKRYVGSASLSFESRWRIHRIHLRKGKHHSRHLQAAWNKYGEDAFVFEIDELSSPEQAVLVEQCCIDFYKSADHRFGYNIHPTAGSPYGIKRSAETRAKMSASKTGTKASAETIAKLRLRKMTDNARSALLASHLGKVVSPETREKLRKSNTGKKRTAETCAKISAIHKGKTISPAQRAAVSKAQKGRGRTIEERAAVSAFFSGRKKSAEHRAKLAESNRGQVRSDQAKENMLLGILRAKYERAAAMFACAWLT